MDALINRAAELGRTLQAMEGDVDTTALDRLDQRIAALGREVATPEQDRRLDLLQRQRQTLEDTGGVDYAYVVGQEEGRFRVNLFKQRGHVLRLHGQDQDVTRGHDLAIVLAGVGPRFFQER